jgi:tetratricopeptide (TPR) repeat protein
MMLRILTALALVAGTASADDAFVAGNHAAVAGDAKGAAAAFERSLAHGWSAATLFDLGNAYASASDWGHSVLAYERAQLLAPRDPAIAANLAHVRADAGIASAPPRAVDRTVALLAADEWTWLALGAGVLACAGIVALGWAYRRRAAATVVIAGTLAAALCAVAAARTAPSADRAVVLARTEARLAPVPTADAVFTAPAGEEVRLGQRHGDFTQVRDGERTGWLPRSAVEPVVPRLQ